MRPTTRTHARARALRVPHKSGWLCIHRYEGSWNSATGNGYYGGLQMDASFEEAYGADVLAYRGGHANVWPRHDQLMVAVRGYEVRGKAPAQIKALLKRRPKQQMSSNGIEGRASEIGEGDAAPISSTCNGSRSRF